MAAVDSRAYRESKPVKPVWIGESKSSGAKLPLRSMIDYLLVPTASAFGRNQAQQPAKQRTRIERLLLQTAERGLRG
jgi:hypothetical protein